MSYLSVVIWRNRRCPVTPGYSPQTDEDTATFRLGPLVIGWESVRHDCRPEPVPATLEAAK